MTTPRRLVALALGALLPAATGAQAVCKPPADRSESKLLAFYAGPLAFSYAPGASALARGQVALLGELTAVPTPPAAISRSSGYCGFNKAENSGLAPVFPRPRVAVGLGAQVVLEGSWLPPVTVADATPHLGAVAVAWTPGGLQRWSNVRVTLRAHATIGGVDGPVTCPSSGLQTASTSQPCYGSTPSDDTYDPNVRGVEAVAETSRGRWRWLAGAGVNATAPHFRVNFTDGRGFVDNNIVEINLVRPALFAGVSWQPEGSLAVSAQVYSVPGDATTARLGIAWRRR